MIVRSKVKYIQSLRHKKSRDEEGVFVAEGPKIINELLNSPGIEVKEIYAVRAWIENHPDTPHGKVTNNNLTEVEEDSLQKISSLTTPNQVLAVFRKPFVDDDISLSGKLTLMTDTIQDPGNLGTIIRCADWYGISQVICSHECADVFSSKTVQSTMGSIARVKVIYKDLYEFIRLNTPVPFYASALSGKSIYEMEPVTEGIIMVGNESRGISPRLLSLASQTITIPRKGHAESLNAAVATGIILSHLIR